MKKRVEGISFSELKKGMIVAKDVEHNGSIIIKEGVVLNEDTIEKLQKVYIVGSVCVYAKESDISLERRKLIEFNHIETEFCEISSRLKNTFDKVFLNDDDYLDDIREFSKKILEKSKFQDLVIKNIVLNGSGSDVIYRHGVNVASLCILLGIWLDMSEAQIKLLAYSAMLHDCGKTKIDTEVLNKPRKLTNNEFKVVQKHAVLGYDMVKKLQYIDKSVSYGVLMHHERLDGSGYPLGIKGDKIHPFAKIIAIADVFDAINSDREYKNKKAPFEALRIVQEESLGKLDYEYVQVFLKHIMNYYLGEEVILNNGDRCRILQMNINDIQRPLLVKDGEFVDLTKHKDLYIEEMLL